MKRYIILRYGMYKGDLFDYEKYYFHRIEITKKNINKENKMNFNFFSQYNDPYDDSPGCKLFCKCDLDLILNCDNETEREDLLNIKSITIKQKIDTDDKDIIFKNTKLMYKNILNENIKKINIEKIQRNKAQERLDTINNMTDVEKESEYQEIKKITEVINNLNNELKNLKNTKNVIEYEENTTTNSICLTSGSLGRISLFSSVGSEFITFNIYWYISYENQNPVQGSLVEDKNFNTGIINNNKDIKSTKRKLEISMDYL